MILSPGGVWFLEAKAPGNKPTKLQYAKLQKMHSIGCSNVHWVDCDPEDVNDLYFRNPFTDDIDFKAKDDN